MPAFEIRDLYQPAVLWKATGGYDHYGRPLTNAPIQVQVRWNKVRREVLDHNGNTVALDAQVVIAQLVPIGSLMWLGSLTSWYGVGSAGQDNEVHEVKVYNETPDIKNRNIRYTLGLMKFMSNPTAANT